MKRAAVYLRAAALFVASVAMAFTYQFGANPPIDYPRMLVADTVQNDANGNRIYAFEDSEIQAATQIEMAVWQSSMFWSGPAGVANLPGLPMPWRRIAATLIDCLASNQARLSILSSLLDAKLNPGATKDMMAQAAALREAEDNSGAFAIIEQVNNYWSFTDRFWKTVARQSAGAPQT